jgi:hypothetical protein
MALVLFALLLSPITTAAQPTGVPAPDEYANAPEPDASVAGPTAPSEEEKAEPTEAEPSGDSPKAEEPKAPVEPPEDVMDAVKDVGLLIEAARNGNWVFFVGLLIMLLIFVLDKLVNLKKHIPAKAVPWVAAALGIVGSMATQLTTGIPWGQALLQGLTAGITAVGLWELIFKHVLDKKSEPPKAEEEEKPDEMDEAEAEEEEAEAEADESPKAD